MRDAPEGHICVFAKPPRPGEAKTRLAPTVGLEAACTLAQAFFADTWSAVATLGWARPVLATTALPAVGLEVEAGAEAWLQGEGDLGARLERILCRALTCGRWSMALGADSPGLPLKFLMLAREALSTHDAVLGPCEDGGFYLLGLRDCPPGLLGGLPWSSARTFACTHARLVERGLSVALLPPWFDVDVPEDLARLTALLEHNELIAPRTARVLASLPSRVHG